MDSFLQESDRFYTAKELADLLKMNHQVILRKLKSGDLEGYKIGKEWRVEDWQLRKWLSSKKNRPVEEDRPKSGAVLGGEPEPWLRLPAEPRLRRAVLERVIEAFPPHRTCSEHEVDEILESFHTKIEPLKRALLRDKLLVRRGERFSVGLIRR